VQVRCLEHRQTSGYTLTATYESHAFQIRLSSSTKYNRSSKLLDTDDDGDHLIAIGFDDRCSPCIIGQGFDILLFCLVRLPRRRWRQTRYRHCRETESLNKNTFPSIAQRQFTALAPRRRWHEHIQGLGCTSLTRVQL